MTSTNEDSAPSSFSPKSGSLLPVRWIISLLGIYSSALVYTQRSALSVTIVAMTETKEEADYIHHCAANKTLDAFHSSHVKMLSSTFSSSTTPTYDWDEKLQGIILGAHFWCYAFAPAIAGRLCDKFGGKWISIFGAAGPFVLALLTPITVDKLGASGLIGVRVLLGLFHGAVFPPLFTLYVRWFPQHERAIANAGMSFGGALGATVMSSLAGALSSTSFGWPLVFYVNALLYLPFVGLWIYYVSDTPDESSRISDAELKYLRKHIAPVKSQSKRKQASFSKIVTSGPVICSLITKMCSGYGYFLLLSKVPSYLATVFGVSLVANGSITAAMTLGQGIVALLAAPISNWIIRITGLRSIIVRKVFQTFAMMGPAAALAIIPLVGCDATAVWACLILSLCAYGLFTGGEWTTISEYAPNSSGTVFGFANSFAVLAGILGPYLVGVILGDDPADHLERWNIVFYSTSAVFVVGCVTFILFGTDQPQSWDLAVSQQIDEDNNIKTDNGSVSTIAASNEDGITRNRQNDYKRH